MSHTEVRWPLSVRRLAIWLLCEFLFASVIVAVTHFRGSTDPFWWSTTPIFDGVHLSATAGLCQLLTLGSYVLLRFPRFGTGILLGTLAAILILVPHALAEPNLGLWQPSDFSVVYSSSLRQILLNIPLAIPPLLVGCLVVGWLQRATDRRPVGATQLSLAEVLGLVIEWALILGLLRACEPEPDWYQNYREAIWETARESHYETFFATMLGYVGADLCLQQAWRQPRWIWLSIWFLLGYVVCLAGNLANVYWYSFWLSFFDWPYASSAIVFVSVFVVLASFFQLGRRWLLEGMLFPEVVRAREIAEQRSQLEVAK